MALMSPSCAWFKSFMIWNLILRSVCSELTAFENAPTMVEGPSGLLSVARSGWPRRYPTPRLSAVSSSWHRFSTTRVMLPVSTASSIESVSTSVSFVASTFE